MTTRTLASRLAMLGGFALLGVGIASTPALACASLAIASLAFMVSGALA